MFSSFHLFQHTKRVDFSDNKFYEPNFHFYDQRKTISEIIQKKYEAYIVDTGYPNSKN